jgi:CRP-like cAMP-binding protein
MNYPFEPIELGPIEQMHALRRLFGADAPLSNEALAAVSKLARAQRVAKDTVLSVSGGPFRFVYLVIEGMLELSREGQRLGVFGSGTGVGVISTLAQDHDGFGCTALTESTLLVLRASDLLEVMEDHFELMHGALRNMAADAIGWRRALPDAGFYHQQLGPCALCSPEPLGLVERILYLRRTIGLEQSYIDELAELARATRELRCAAGTQLWSAGDRADYLVIVVSGEVSGVTPEGAHFQFGPGDILGNLDTVAGVQRWFDARAKIDLVALTLDSEALVDVWEDHPDLGFAFLRMLSRLLLTLRIQAAKLQLPAATGS